MMLVRNGKLIKSNTRTKGVYSFGIVAYKSRTGLLVCSKASNCISTCYARTQNFKRNVVIEARERNLALSQQYQFVYLMQYDLDIVKKKHKKLYVRVHDGGDFYSEKSENGTSYLFKWFSLAKNNPEVTFYAYTKRVSLVKSVKVPQNLTFIFSLGGKEDHLIDLKKDRHAKVFKNKYALQKARYSNASENDLISIKKNKKVGLIYRNPITWGNSNFRKAV